jgi:hypothetical protein
VQEVCEQGVERMALLRFVVMHRKHYLAESVLG